MTSHQLFTSLIDFILHSKLESNELIDALDDKYCITIKSELSLRCIDKYKESFDNDYKTDEKVCMENGFNPKQLEKAKYEFWNSKELDEEMTVLSFQKVQQHFLNWCRKNKERIKDVKNNPVKAIQPTVKQIIQEEKKERPKYAESEAEYLWEQAMQTQFKLFKDKGILSPHSPTMQYKIFVERGLIKQGDCEQFLSRAKEIVITQKKLLRTFPESKFHRDALTDSIHRMQEDKYSDTDRAEINQQAKLLSIENYYNSLTDLNFSKIRSRITFGKHYKT